MMGWMDNGCLSALTLVFGETGTGWNGTSTAIHLSFWARVSVPAFLLPVSVWGFALTSFLFFLPHLFTFVLLYRAFSNRFG